jgi:FkbM family methyltransferase
MSKLLEKAVSALGYRYYKIDYQPFGLDHAVDIRRFLTPTREVKMIFDVGANEGQSAAHYVEVFRHAEIYSFEPVNDTYRKLVDRVREWECVRPFQLALGNTNGQVSIRLSYSSVHNSLKNRADFADAIGVEQIEVRTLDSFVAEHHIDRLDLLKTDTEGFDLEVLRGGEKTLEEGRIGFIFCEVTFSKGDKAHTSFFNVAEYVRRFGFEFVDLYDNEYVAFAPRRPPLHFCNALFYRTGWASF